VREASVDLSRTEERRRDFHVYLDEFQNFTTVPTENCI
jgi:hypothetical protein